MVELRRVKFSIAEFRFQLQVWQCNDVITAATKAIKSVVLEEGSMEADRTPSSVSAPLQCSCKVSRGIDKYEMAGIDDELVHRWAEGKQGLRKLADLYNRELIRHALLHAGIQPLDGECENIRRILVEPDVTEGMRVQLHKRFENNGIDTHELVRDFVSYQTVNRHLQQCLEIERSTAANAPITKSEGIDRIYGLQKRTEHVVENTLIQLERAGEIQVGNIDVIVSMGVSCSNCGGYRDIEDVIDHGCHC